MEISQLISPHRVVCLSGINSKKRLLENMGQLLSYGIDGSNPTDIFHHLVERERLGSTGLGHGVALPHARSGTHDMAVGAFIRLDKAVDFDSPDSQPADLIFGLLVPEHHTSEHLEILASLAGMFTDQSLCQSLRECQQDDEVFQIFANWQQSGPGS